MNNLPDAVEDGAVGKDAHVHVGYDNVVKVALAFVRKEQIRHPNFARIGKSQIFNFTFFKRNERIQFRFLKKS